MNVVFETSLTPTMAKVTFAADRAAGLRDD
jgi:hypothetical protein